LVQRWLSLDPNVKNQIKAAVQFLQLSRLIFVTDVEHTELIWKGSSSYSGSSYLEHCSDWTSSRLMARTYSDTSHEHGSRQRPFERINTGNFGIHLRGDSKIVALKNSSYFQRPQKCWHNKRTKFWLQFARGLSTNPTKWSWPVALLCIMLWSLWKQTLRKM
jgi:hypothetical protein